MKKNKQKNNSNNINKENKAKTHSQGPGRNKNNSDEELKEIALDLKNKYNGRKLTYLFLETETGIGRQIWSRRMAETIHELNTPPSRQTGLSDSDEVYFPNIQHLFDVHGKNHKKIIQELQFVQDTFYELYDKYKFYRNESEKAEKYKNQLESKEKELDEAKHYKQRYYNIAVSSSFSHLRREQGINDNIINFEKDIEQNTSLTKLDEFFSNIEIEEATTAKKISEHSLKRKDNNLTILKKLAPNIIDSEVPQDE